MNSIIKIENLKLNYGNQEILKNIELNIYENKITSIIGPSGCGKSTLLKCINRIIDESTDMSMSGSIYFNDKNIQDYNLEDLRKNIGMVFQQSTPFPLSIYKNLEYALKYHGISKKERKVLIETTLKLTGLYEEISPLMNKSALKLSGGQAQRLCIARALTISPKILLLDEPCSALDVINTKKIEELLICLKETYTIIIVTHNLAQAKRISDRTIFMYDGEVIEDDSTKNLFSIPKKQLTKEYVSGDIG
ncbi:phosphate ABC transporter ATP-binding protein [Clostridium sp.]|uniref:phosphate ABC transporter ATP-binding protein n=1 Tax=Clostridium sp. TaxID=1506 RepID=UPI00321747B6